MLKDNPMTRTLLATFLLATTAHAAPDLVVTGDKITTSDPARPAATGFAVTGGRFSYVGTAAGALRLAGPGTKVVRLGTARVLPGLVDAHIHPLGIVDIDVCDLKSEAKSLREIANIVRGCLARYKPKPGEPLGVAQWNFAGGNQPDAEHPTLRAALDRAAPDNPVNLVGNDGHHGAYNSAALAKAMTPDGKVIGLSKATLAGPFSRYRELVGVDSNGEPSGGVNEAARAIMGGKAVDVADVKAVLAAPEKMTGKLNAAGITAVLDAAAEPESFVVYDTLQARGALSAHVTLAQFYDPDVMLKADGTPDIDTMVAQATKWQAHYATNPLIRADTVKLFADGVLEANPLSTPPTLGNSPVITPYLQPVFGRDANGSATFSGRYVDPNGPECRGAAAANVASFTAAHGFHPGQCIVGSGRLQHPRPVIMEFVRRMHQAGLAVHIHAIGDAAVRTAVDALEQARVGDTGPARRPGTLAHLQIVHPAEVARIGRMKLFLAFTYAWILHRPGLRPDADPVCAAREGRQLRAAARARQLL